MKLKTIQSLRIIWKILSIKNKREAIVLSFMSIIGALLETIGIGLIIPILDLLSNKNIVNDNYFFSLLSSASGNPPYEKLVILTIFLYFVIYIIKAIYLVLLSWFHAKFTYGVKADIGNRLIVEYIKAPYEFHLERNSSHLIRNITSECTHLVGNLLNPAVVLLSEIFLALMVVFLLFLVEPIGSLIVFLTMAISVLIFQIAIEKFSSILGYIRQEAEGKIIQKAQEALGGIKDVKVLKRINFFTNEFSYNNNKASHVASKQYVIAQLPRHWLELIGIFGLSLLMVILIQFTKSPEEIIPTVGLFALAAFRLLPSANRILNSINSFRYGETVSNLLHSELKINQSVIKKAQIKLKFEDNIALQNISYRYPGAKSNSLSNLSLVINKGESIGIVGKSGAGKSSLVDIILGLLNPSNGGVYIDGVNINEGLTSWQQKVGYVQQNIFITDNSLRNNIAFGLKEEEIDSKLLENAINKANLRELVNNLPNGVNTFLGERGVRLSGGQKQRIGIARALYHNPPILVFDEATSALDSATELDIVNEIKSLKGSKTIIIVAHRPSTIQSCDKIIKIVDGKISNIN